MIAVVPVFQPGLTREENVRYGYLDRHRPLSWRPTAPRRPAAPGELLRAFDTWTGLGWELHRNALVLQGTVGTLTVALIIEAEAVSD
ncbi:MAG TPA: hypothetical protein VNN17_05635 [Terriglobia bacterium]|nr:hypothetical protein [Terriglobia bacterium]